MSLEYKRLHNRQWELIDKICELLQSADAYKALNALKKVIRERDELKGYVNEVVALVGVDNIGNALSKIKASGMGQVVPSVLPPELSRVPQIWLEGRPRSGKDPGFVRFEWYEAEREYKRLRPLLEEVWEAIELEPEGIRERLRAEVLSEYETLSPDEMGRHCIAFVNKYDLKEIVERNRNKDPLVMPSEEELESSLQLVTDPDIIYGVVKKAKK